MNSVCRFQVSVIIFSNYQCQLFFFTFILLIKFIIFVLLIYYLILVIKIYCYFIVNYAVTPYTITDFQIRQNEQK